MNNPQSKKTVLDNIEKAQLIDTYRQMYPNTRRYTFRKWNTTQTSRLDFFLISQSLWPYITESQILTRFRSDHNPIKLIIDFKRFESGRGFWRFNNTLLKDTEYVQKINKIIQDTTKEYTNNPDEFSEIYWQNTHINDIQNITLNINPQQFLNTLSMKKEGKQ